MSEREELERRLVEAANDLDNARREFNAPDINPIGPERDRLSRANSYFVDVGLALADAIRDEQRENDHD